MLRGFTGDWWVVGGRAIEVFTESPELHKDIDNVLLRADLPELRALVGARYHLRAVSDGAMTPLWPDQPDTAPPDLLQLRLRRNATWPWQFDVLFNPGDRGRWVNRRWPSIVMPLDQATCTGENGVRYLRPEIVLLFKARHARENDQQDFDATLPVLDAVQRGWLREWRGVVHPGHAWPALI
jgi:hypothetical protein